MNSTYVQLKKNLEYLKLNQMDLHLDEVIDLITSSPLSFTEGLCKLTNYEIDFKEANMIRSMVKVGAFPHQKGISDFDFEFQPSVNPEEIKDFATLRFLENAENIVFLGPSGVGKTHLATAIGVTAAKKRYSTYFIKCHDLIMQLKKAKLENRLEARLKHFFKYKLLIIDELGYLPIEKDDGQVAGGLIAHQTGNFADQLAEFLNGGLLVAQNGQLMLDQGMIEDVYVCHDISPSIYRVE